MPKWVQILNYRVNVVVKCSIISFDHICMQISIILLVRCVIYIVFGIGLCMSLKKNGNLSMGLLQLEP
jgi:hypothetical protein